ncbi:CorA Metal Ion Transporter (MIT) Family [Phytophthora cinnamomi]|uniref:CorA Metal Ion Transporter (MIT) Family n=1 Tax=Phytophthora cinnamomi TaxID=4785 RepID=UPI0035595F42|nr:CorA Metal Ion Transporter (MIT) Family [Phytophthora cinnamomi]
MSEPLDVDSMHGESEIDTSPSPLLAGAVAQQSSDNPATAYGTYQRMIEVRSPETVELGSSSHSSFKKYACQFDPGSKSGRVLVMLFDRKGRPTLKEMSRHEVLRMTQEAAEPKEDVSPEESAPLESGKMSPPMRRRSSSTAGKIWRLGLQTRSGSQQDLHAPVGVQRVHARDIRKMENAFSVTNEPRIVIRKQAILISADPLRAIVLRDVCLVYVPDGADALLSVLKAKFVETARDDDAPFEFRALEALLSTLSRYFQSHYEQLSPGVVRALDSLMQGGLNSRELEKLREFKNAINEFEAQVDGVRRVLMVLLDNEEDLRLLYLTRLYDEPSLLSDLWSIDSEEIEVLIENYLQDIFSTRTKAELMQHRISNTESLVMMQLDSVRNYLLGVDVIFSIVVISLSVGTFIAGVFGMNLHSGLEEADGWFLGVVILTVSIFVVMTMTGVLYFKSKGVLLQ